MTLTSISFDDADSPEGGCTTHLAGLFLLYITRLGGVEPADYPLLVRLNPGVPWKTRGNAAVVVRVYADRDPMELYEIAVSMAEEYAGSRRPLAGKGYGVAVYTGPPWLDNRLRWLYRKGLTDIVLVDVARSVARKSRVALAGGRGVVGAVSALAALSPHDDYTFELIAYREPALIGEPRCTRGYPHTIAVEARIPPCTFNNTRGFTLVAAPHGPDPVLAGFRGDCPEALPVYSRLLCEKPHFWVLYRSNQHTDAHAIPLKALRPYATGRVAGRVASAPSRIPGGHVIVTVSTPLGVVDAAFFRETGPMREAAARLMPGDEVEIQGTIRPYTPRGRPTLAADKLTILTLEARTMNIAPRCPRCGARMKSAGKGKGYKCPRCGYHDPSARPIRVILPRDAAPGVYVPEPGWLRHLTMPPHRRPQRKPPTPPPTWDAVVSLGNTPPSPHGTPRFPLEPT